MAVSDQYESQSQQQEQQTQQMPNQAPENQPEQQHMHHEPPTHHHLPQQHLSQMHCGPQLQESPDKPPCPYQQPLQYAQQYSQNPQGQTVYLQPENTQFEIAAPYRFRQPRFSTMANSMHEPIDSGLHSNFPSSSYSPQLNYPAQQQQISPQPRYPLERNPLPDYHSCSPRQQVQPYYIEQPQQQQQQPQQQQHHLHHQQQQHHHHHQQQQQLQQQDVSMAYEATQIEYYNIDPSQQEVMDSSCDPMMSEQYDPNKMYHQQPLVCCMPEVTLQEPGPVMAGSAIHNSPDVTTSMVSVNTLAIDPNQSRKAPDEQPDIDISMIDFQEIPYVEGTSWCSIDYHEYSKRVGEKFNCVSRIISVDGYTHPLCNDRFCIGGLSNINRNEFTEWVRRRIGRGIKLTYINGQVYVNCLSESSVFVSSPLMSFVNGDDMSQENVTKVTRGTSYKVFDSGIFSQFLSNAIPKGFEAVYKLTSFSSFRISFVKGWGRDYKRHTISNAPCWIEVQLNGPLQWIDKVLRQLKPPLGCGSTS